MVVTIAYGYDDQTIYVFASQATAA